MFLKRSWIVEETVCQTHKQYNAYEVWKLFGVEVRSTLLYENGKTGVEMSGWEEVFTNCTFLSAETAYSAIRERKRVLVGAVSNKPTVTIIHEEE